MLLEECVELATTDISSFVCDREEISVKVARKKYDTGNPKHKAILKSGKIGKII